jgi:hypothetical protein
MQQDAFITGIAFFRLAPKDRSGSLGYPCPACGPEARIAPVQYFSSSDFPEHNRTIAGAKKSAENYGITFSKAKPCLHPRANRDINKIMKEL